MVIAQDSTYAPKLLLVDANGKLILGDAEGVIGSVNEARGKTILYDHALTTAATTTMRTVTAGKTYYLLQAGVTYHCTGDEKTGGIWIVSNANNLIKIRTSITATYNTAVSDTITVTYPHPIPIAAGQTIRVNSSAAELTVRGWIVGWEE